MANQKGIIDGLTKVENAVNASSSGAATNTAFQFQRARVNVIDTDVAFSNGTRVARDYDNSSNGDDACVAYMSVQFDAGPPATNSAIAELYVLPGDGAGTEVYPIGGDGSAGSNADPQGIWFVGSYETKTPSTSEDEELALFAPLYPNGNRFVVKNISGQDIDATWQLDIVPSNERNIP